MQGNGRGRASSPVFRNRRAAVHPATPRLLGGYRARMNAAVHTRYGPPNVVRVVDVPTPTAKDNEVLVKVHATTVNRTDCGFRQLVRSATCACWNSPGKHLQVPHVTLGERSDSGMSAPCRTVSR